MDLQSIRIGSLIFPGLIMSAFYFFAVFFHVLSIFIISLNVILIYVIVVDYLRYRPKYLPYLENAAVVGVIIFFFVVIQNIAWVL